MALDVSFDNDAILDVKSGDLTDVERELIEKATHQFFQ
jgi:hypothetical protein